MSDAKVEEPRPRQTKRREPGGRKNVGEEHKIYSFVGSPPLRESLFEN